MATIRKDKRTGHWQCLVRKRGFPHLSETFPLRAQAAAWGAQQEAAIIHGRLGILPKHTLRRALEKFRDEVTPKRRGAKWERNRINALLGVDKGGQQLRPADPITEAILPTLDSSHLSELRDRELARPSARTGKLPETTTVRRLFSLLHSVFREARGWKWMTHNPFEDFQRPPGKRGRRRGVRQEEVDAIVNSLGFNEAPPTTLAAQIAVEFLLEIETAMRDGEMLSLEWPQVFPKHVHLEETKNGDERDVPLSQRARGLIGLMRGMDPVKVFTVEAATRDTLFREARVRAGLKGFTFHDGRSEALSRLSQRPGMHILKLARITGHRDINSLQIYYQDRVEDVADELD